MLQQTHTPSPPASQGPSDALLLVGGAVLVVLVGSYLWLRSQPSPSATADASATATTVASDTVPPPAKPSPPPSATTREPVAVAQEDRAPVPIPSNLLKATASTQAAQWEEYTFGVANLLDGDTTSSWQPVQTGKGPGEWFMLKLSRPQTLAGIEIWNGFQRTDRLGALYKSNSRIKTATLELSNGAKRQLDFEDEETKSTFLFKAPHEAIKWVKVTVNTVYTGSKWDDLAVSEVKLLVPAESNRGGAPADPSSANSQPTACEEARACLGRCGEIGKIILAKSNVDAVKEEMLARARRGEKLDGPCMATCLAKGFETNIPTYYEKCH